MGTTGHYVGYYEVDSTDKVKEYLRKEYTWSEWEVIDLAPGTKHRSNWWVIMKQRETDKIRAMVVHTTNRAKREGMFYTKEVAEDMGPYATDIPKRLFAMLTPLEEGESQYAAEWRDLVISGTVRA
jgi:hypothetical protein